MEISCGKNNPGGNLCSFISFLSLCLNNDQTTACAHSISEAASARNPCLILSHSIYHFSKYPQPTSVHPPIEPPLVCTKRHGRADRRPQYENVSSATNAIIITITQRPVRYENDFHRSVGRRSRRLRDMHVYGWRTVTEQILWRARLIWTLSWWKNWSTGPLKRALICPIDSCGYGLSILSSSRRLLLSYTWTNVRGLIVYKSFPITVRHRISCCAISWDWLRLFISPGSLPYQRRLPNFSFQQLGSYFSRSALGKCQRSLGSIHIKYVRVRGYL